MKYCLRPMSPCVCTKHMTNVFGCFCYAKNICSIDKFMKKKKTNKFINFVRFTRNVKHLIMNVLNLS